MEVLGAIPRNKGMTLTMRHLGLVPAREGASRVEDFDARISKIKEIIGMMAVTHVPQTPGFVKGVINLRGKVIPVVDLRLLAARRGSICAIASTTWWRSSTSRRPTARCAPICATTTWPQ